MLIFIVSLNDINYSNVNISLIIALHAANTGETIPITNSRSELPTANAAPDQPQTEPDSDMSMPNPSQFLTTFSLMGGQLPSSSMIVPTAETSTATTVNIQPATSTSVENSVRSQMPIIPCPTSTGKTMLSCTYTFTSTTTTIDTQPVVTVTSSVISTKKLSLMSTPLVFSTRTSTVALLLPTSTTKTTTLSISIEPPSPDQSVTGIARHLHNKCSPIIFCSTLELSSSESILLATTPPGPQNLERGSLGTAATVIIILAVLTFVVLTAALIGILAQKYRKRRYRYYPAFKHTILEEDESSYSQTGTIARFGKLCTCDN